MPGGVLNNKLNKFDKASNYLADAAKHEFVSKIVSYFIIPNADVKQLRTNNFSRTNFLNFNLGLKFHTDETCA